MEFRILGPLEVIDEHGPVAFGTIKERVVLAVLLLHANEVVSREGLIDELWGDSPPPAYRFGAAASEADAPTAPASIASINATAVSSLGTT